MKKFLEFIVAGLVIAAAIYGLIQILIWVAEAGGVL